MTDNAIIEWDLASLIERGGVHYNVPGASQKELLAGAIGLLPLFPAIDPRDLLREILDREALASTGIGKGIALPHPRMPMAGDASPPLVALIFPAVNLDWNTPDGGKVHTIFLIVSSTAKQHLGVLSKINFLSQQEKFYSMIKARSPKEEIIASIREAETTWARSVL